MCDPRGKALVAGLMPTLPTALVSRVGIDTIEQPSCRPRRLIHQMRPVQAQCPPADVHFPMLPSSEDIAARVIEIIAKSKSLPTDTITPASTFEELQIDSLDKINLTFEVEEVFKITIPDDSLTSLRTVADVISGVQALLAAKAAAES